MKTPSRQSGVVLVAAAAAGLSAVRNRDPVRFERAFQHLTPAALDYLDRALSEERAAMITDGTGINIGETTTPAVMMDASTSSPSPSSSSVPSSSSSSSSSVPLHSDGKICSSSNNNNNAEGEEGCHERRVIATALLRRIVHKCLDKYSERASPQQVEEALKYHTLPEALRSELAARYNRSGGSGGGGEDAPTPTATWYDALQDLVRVVAAAAASEEGGDDGDDDPATTATILLWDLLLDHPMTAYVAMQCQSCGHVVPDESGPPSDSDLGLAEDDPTESEAPLVRGGWFRGRPRPARVLVLTCPRCNAVSRWFRSGDPRTILNPHRWGRLCGEQQGLRLDLARYLGLPTPRTCIPLDWDHVWSEDHRGTTSDVVVGDGDGDVVLPKKTTARPYGGEWYVRDESARNFAARLDEGIGSWTAVLAISPHPDLCEDATDDYLQCRLMGGRGVGRADDRFSAEMGRYRDMVKQARTDPSGTRTQAGTVNGYALQRTGFVSSDVTATLRRAVHDYGVRAWYELTAPSDTVVVDETDERD
jgi:hypothetical protein